MNPMNLINNWRIMFLKDSTKVNGKLIRAKRKKSVEQGKYLKTEIDTIKAKNNYVSTKKQYKTGKLFLLIIFLSLVTISMSVAGSNFIEDWGTGGKIFTNIVLILLLISLQVIVIYLSFQMTRIKREQYELYKSFWIGQKAIVIISIYFNINFLDKVYNFLDDLSTIDKILNAALFIILCIALDLMNVSLANYHFNIKNDIKTKNKKKKARKNNSGESLINKVQKSFRKNKEASNTMGENGSKELSYSEKQKEVIGNQKKVIDNEKVIPFDKKRVNDITENIENQSKILRYVPYIIDYLNKKYKVDGEIISVEDLKMDCNIDKNQWQPIRKHLKDIGIVTGNRKTYYVKPKENKSGGIS